MEIFVCTSDLNLLILIESCKRLLAIDNVHIQSKFLKRTDRSPWSGHEVWYDDDAWYHNDVLSIELFVPHLKSKNDLERLGFNTYGWRKPIPKPLSLAEFKSLDITRDFDSYVSEFYHRYSGKPDITAVQFVSSWVYLKEFNLTGAIGKLCAGIFSGHDESRYPILHKHLILLNECLTESFNSPVEYVFPPISSNLDMREDLCNEDHEGW